ncbi:MAG: hypothetical protein ACKV19_12405 [Verrucomicrobiales bacterium]
MILRRPAWLALTAVAAATVLMGTPVMADYSALLREGDRLDVQRRTAEALAVYRQAEKLAPERAEILHRIAKQLGESIQDVKDSERGRQLAVEALGYARRAVDAAPENADAQVAVAICLGLMTPYQSNKERIAASRLIKRHAERALAIDPGHELAHYVLGAWHEGLASLSPVMAGLAGVVYGRLPEASHQQAVTHFRGALAINPQRAANWLGLGIALARLGQSADARVAFERAIALPVRYKDDEATKARARQRLEDLR